MENIDYSIVETYCKKVCSEYENQNGEIHTSLFCLSCMKRMQERDEKLKENKH
jgi:hypothetical protein